MSHRDWEQHEHRGTVRRRDEYDESWDYSKRRRYDVSMYRGWAAQTSLTPPVGL